MMSVNIKVVSVKGTCNAHLAPGDTFLLEEFRLTPQGHKKTCGVACASLVANFWRLKLQPRPIYVSCPDPGTGEGANVLFELSLAENGSES